MHKLMVTVKTTSDYQAFARAVEEYIALVTKEAREPRYIKHWATFVNNWTDYLTKGMAVEKVSKKMLIDSQVQRIMKGDL